MFCQGYRRKQLTGPHTSIAVAGHEDSRRSIEGDPTLQSIEDGYRSIAKPYGVCDSTKRIDVTNRVRIAERIDCRGQLEIIERLRRHLLWRA
jgi:hypothetical protein